MGLVFYAAGAGGFQGIAADEFGDVRGEIPGFEGNFVAGAADVDGEAAEDARGERGGIGFQGERDKDDFEGRAVAFRAGEIHGGAAGLQVRRGKNYQRGGRSSENEGGVSRDGDLVGVGVAAKAATGDFEAVSHGGDLGYRIDLHGICWGFARRGDRDGHSAFAADDRPVDQTGSERSDEEGAASGVGGEPVAIRKEDGSAGSEAAVGVEHGESSAVAGDDGAREQEYAPCGSR
jgi:hypothetical protein